MPSEDYNEKIELLVNDENRIVTYKILSQELKIHVNKAKQCLMDYFNAQKAKGISLSVLYFLAGFVEKDGMRSIKVSIVPEDKLEVAKQSYIELTSFHLYSLSKVPTFDECALYSADFTYVKDKDEQRKYSAIKHPNIDIQPPVLNKEPIKPDVKPSIPRKVNSNIPVNGNLTSESKKPVEPKIAEKETSPEEKKDTAENESADPKKNKISPEDKKQKSGSLMSMWQKQNGLKKDSAKTEVKGKEAAKPLPKNNILSMFSKQAVKNAEKPPVPKPVVSKEDDSPKALSNNANLKENSPKKAKTDGNKKSSHKRKASNKTSKQSSKSKHNSDSEDDFQPKAKKKHRRICTFDDSDSDSEPEEEREKAQRSFFLPEEPMETSVPTLPSDDEEPIPPTPPAVIVKGKAKVWKSVKKTFEDEEGFFVTKTEKELVSEDEENPLKVEPKKEEPIVSKKSSSVNKKQSSLMSFFKQK